MNAEWIDVAKKLFAAIEQVECVPVLVSPHGQLARILHLARSCAGQQFFGGKLRPPSIIPTLIFLLSMPFFNI